MKNTCFPILLGILALAAPLSAADTPSNLIRNGSLEGGLLYWHNIRPEHHGLVEPGKNSGHALRIGDEWVMSAPFTAERGANYTISLWARSAGDKGRVSVSMPPSAREVGQKSGRLWTKGAGKSEALTGEWQRLSFTFPADVPQTGFWPLPHYMVMISSGKGAPILVDGVTVTKGDSGAPDYLPRGAVEVVAECTNLPGYKGASANVFEKGATAQIAAHVFNPGAKPVNVTLRWQLRDYENAHVVGEAVEQEVTVPPGGTVSETRTLPLVATGCVLATVTAHIGDEQIDVSQIPITSLPYPKNATAPDYRERFGGSFAGGVGCLEKFQRIGFGWTRWYPEGKWHNYQPNGPDEFTWHDAKFEEAWKRGVSAHVVLYGWPEWIMDKEHPLPRDMRWPADDPRWEEDLSVVTAWDRFVTEAVRHFKGKSVVFQIANEPGHDKWDGFHGEYVKFNLRTARLIKQTDPKAQVSVNNVYTNPSGVNAALLRSGKLADFDVWSWHDYHAGWLTDADGMRRIRQMLDEAGGKHMAIWFTEGWAFTNTAVDQPIACTSLTSAESTNAIMDSMAEITVNGQEKTVFFHTAYETHGMSFWDYSGPGTMLWDWYDYPLPLVGAWNVLNHHIGLSDVVGFVRPSGANFCIFQDLRNERGVMIAYADRGAQEDAAVELPIDGLTAEDIMGNPWPIEGRKLVLPKSGRPVVLYAAGKAPGREFLAALEPLDRKHLGFAETTESGATYRLPATWEGIKKGASDGNPITANGRAIWRLDRVWPDKIIMAENYHPLPWEGTRWHTPEHSQGGQPAVTVKDGDIDFSVRSAWTGNEGQKLAALVFLAPETGIYKVSGKARAKPWEGGLKTFPLAFLKKDTQRAAEVEKLELAKNAEPKPFEFSVELSAGHELVILPLMPHMHNGAQIIVSDLVIRQENGK